MFIPMLDDKPIEVSSTHRQQMILPIDAELIGFARQLGYHFDGDKSTDTDLPLDYREPEIAFIHKTSSLLVQGHPEHPGYNAFTSFFWELIDLYLDNPEAIN